MSNISPGQFARAPIIEAVLEIRISPLPLSSLSLLKSVVQSENYARVDEMIVNQFEWQSEVSAEGIAPDVRTQVHQQSQGWLAHKNDGRGLIEVRLDGFAFHRFAPYGSWGDFSDAARAFWESYRDVVAQTADFGVTQIGLRYTNRLPLPFTNGQLDFNDYLTMFPPNVAMAHSVLSNFYLRFELPQPDLQAMLVLQQGLLQERPDDDTVFVLLDLDLFRSQSLPQDETDLWSSFEAMRERKNQVFTACLSRAAQELIS